MHRRRWTQAPPWRAFAASATAAALLGAVLAPAATLAVGNGAPIPGRDSISILEDNGPGGGPATGHLFANDTDPDNDTLTLSSMGPLDPANGTLAVAPNGDYTYTPPANWSGTGMTWYFVSDGHGHIDIGYVDIAVAAVNDAPVAQAHAVATGEDTPVDQTAAQLTSGATDVESNPITVVGVSNATGGEADYEDGVATFEPADDLCGPAAGGYDYTLEDSLGATGTAHVTIDITCVNDAPVAQAHAVATGEDTPVDQTAAQLTSGATDVESNPITVVGVSNATGGEADFEGAVATFAPAQDVCGPAAGGYDYTLEDSLGSTGTAHVTIDITCVNDVPVAGDDSAAGPEDQDVVIDGADLLANDTDSEGTSLVLASVSGATHGSVDLSGDTVTFSPAGNYCGQAGFDYRASDGDALSGTAHVTIAIACVNDAPVAVDDVRTVAEDSGAATYDVLANDSDVDDAALVVASVSGATHGTVALASGHVTFSPAADYCGQAGFAYRASDGGALSGTAHVTVTITCVNDAPVAGNDSATGSEDHALVIDGADLLANDTDTEGTSLVLASVSGATHGTVALAGGHVTFSPAGNYCGQAGFAYRASDGGALSSPAHVTIAIACVNDAPVAANDEGTVAEASGAALYDVLANDSDAEHAALSVSNPVVDAVQGTASVASNQVRFTPAASFRGDAVITYTVSDGVLTARGKLTVTVETDTDDPVPTAPTAAFGIGRVNESAPLAIRWSATDAGVGVAGYEVQVRIGNAAWAAAYRGSATSVTRLYPFRKPLAWRMRATDKEGNVSNWVVSATRSLTAYQGGAPVVRTGTWRARASTGSSGSGYVYTTTRGKKAGLSFTGMGVLYVAAKTPAAGYVKVYVDGAYAGRFKLRASSTSLGAIVKATTWAASGSHSIRFVNDQAGRRAILDAFVVLR